MFIEADLACRGVTLDFVYGARPSQPPSRPNPLSRTPPNPADASNILVPLIQMTPAFIFGASPRQRFIFSLQIDAAKPYRVLFANCMASAGVLNVVETSTGPKISFCIKGLAVSTSVINVGG